MDDDFYDSGPLRPTISLPSGLVTILIPQFMSRSLLHFVGTILAIFLSISIVTRLFTGNDSERVAGKNGRTVWTLPYWIPFVGHGYQFFTNPKKLMDQARDESNHGIFALTLGPAKFNIVSDPGLVKGVMQQRESAVQFIPISRTIFTKFFGIPKSAKAKYEATWEDFTQGIGLLLKEPYLNKMLQGTMRILEQNIPQMISFMESEVDQHSWERYAQANFISDMETEISLMSLMRDMLGNASVPGLFGSALLEKYPDLLHDVYEMDGGMYFFLMGLPAFTPWPGVLKAHMARSRVWTALDDQQSALDATADGKPVDPSWGDFDDVSDFIKERHETFKKHGFEVKERGDISILWALIVNANLLVFWHILYILATPELVARIRAEISPFVKISKPESIGKISEAPKLSIDHEGLSKNCPLFKSTYFEALRLNSQPWSIRTVATDVCISGDRNTPVQDPFIVHKGEYITVPHDLHMLDPKYFKDPLKFDPDRFLVRNDNGSLSADQGTIRPYGGGPSMCKGRVFAERECLGFVAGVLMFWDIEPGDKKAGWVIPELKKASAVCLPTKDVRVRVTRRRFEWDE